MTNVCEKFANLHQLKFSTNVDVSKSKTKCIVFSNPVINTDNICPILLNNLPLPYVTEIKHLGNTLQSNGSMSKDVKEVAKTDTRAGETTNQGWKLLKLMENLLINKTKSNFYCVYTNKNNG